MDQASWNASHVAAFEFFGGVPARLVCDNLKTGVVRPDLYDPQINLAYRELASFYGTLVDPARAGKPKDKPRIERPIPNIRDSLFAGRYFESMPQMQGEALRWCREVYGRHKRRGIDGQTPASLFDAVEREALIPLPPRPFEAVTYTLGKVAPNCHVKSGKALYSVPWRLIGQQVTVRAAGDVVQIFHDHTVWPPMSCICRDARPIFSTTRRTRSPTPCARQAGVGPRPKQIGPGAVAIVAELSAVNAIHRLRAIQGIIRLRETYGDARLDAACARAITVGDPGYRTVKGILAAGTEHGDDRSARPAQIPPAMLRGPDAFDTEQTA